MHTKVVFVIVCFTLFASHFSLHYFFLVRSLEVLYVNKNCSILYNEIINTAKFLTLEYKYSLVFVHGILAILLLLQVFIEHVQ